MKVEFLDLKKQYQSIKSEITIEINNVIESQQFIKGEKVKEFEKSFSEYLNIDYCVGVANGTDALEISIGSLNLPKGSEIIVPSNSFISTAEAVVNTGNKVVFCDISQSDYSLDINCLKNLINEKTRAIIVVHLYGIPSIMDDILSIVNSKKLYLIEDCAQAHGAKYNNKKVGSFGDLGCFSFYPGKNLGAYGDAGAIVTNNRSLSEKCRMLANHGRVEKYNHKIIGRNSRLDSIQAAVLNVKLKYIDVWTNHRRKIAELYHEKLSKINEIKLFELNEFQNAVYHLYVIRIKKRDLLMEFLNQKGIETGIHYPISLNKLEAFSFIEQDTLNFRSNQIANEILSLPIGDQIEQSKVKYVCQTIIRFYES